MLKTVSNQNTDRSNADGHQEEALLRVQLAEFYHLVAYLGWTEMIFNHISLRVPGPDGHYLVNPFGLHYEEVTPDNLVKVDVEGNLVGTSDYPPNRTGFALHGAIHEARDDIHCIAHTHTTPISAIALKEDGFTYDDFYGAQLYGRVGYHAFEGVTVFAEERPRMIASLGDRNVLVLRNHGIAVGERDVPRTFWLLYTAQRAAEIQCQAGTLPGANTGLGVDVRERCSQVAEELIAGDAFAAKLFDAMMRKVRRDKGPLWAGDTAPDRLR
ncbi:class II aldolase/adducin family protein [Stappia sp. MMSF_3263]|uniref:class II aldolase/adducin family protein n=1 Tax=Stappia sp. MMSF_3263 TaxID=3046693 RepID=UPI00273E3802|nr:class II aldolase/adducin family protein [Stappia sp. MMSF_3263]